MTHTEKPRPVLNNAFFVPLSVEEHAQLNNPPDIAYLAVKEGHATRQHVWNLWYRARVTLNIVEKHHKGMVDEVRPIVERIEAFFLDLHRNQQKEIRMEIHDLMDVGALLEFAKEVQQETNRAQQLEAYRSQRKYCIDTVASLQTA